jgi:hypothetical protein
MSIQDDVNVLKQVMADTQAATARLTTAISESVQAEHTLQQAIVDGNTAIASIEAQLPPPQPPSGVIRVKAGDNLQAVVDAVKPGDTVLLDPAGTWPTIRLRATGAGGRWFLETDGAPNPIGSRVTAAEAAGFAKLGGGNGPAITTDPGGGNVEIRNIAFLPNANAAADRFSTVVALGHGMEKDVNDLAHAVTLRRVFCAVQWQTQRQRRFTRAECTDFAMVDSRLEGLNYKTPDDAQGFLTTNSPGPFHLQNDHIEATGENVLFGGGDPQIKNLVPGEAGTVIRGCYLYKPLAWKYDSITNPTGLRGYVKNLLELKNARNVLVDGCVMENVWVDAQSGDAILLTVRNQDNSAPWSTLENIEIRNCRIINVPGYAFLVLGIDDKNPSTRAKDLRLVNVQIERSNRGIFLNSGPDGFVMEHVTFSDTKAHFLTFENKPTDRLAVNHNLCRSGYYGIHSPAGLGVQALNAYAPGWSWGVNACEKSKDTTTNIPFPAGTTLLAPGAVTYAPALDRYVPIVQGADAKPVGADVSTVPDPR